MYLCQYEQIFDKGIKLETQRDGIKEKMDAGHIRRMTDIPRMADIRRMGDENGDESRI